jgi:hypothetical protein
MNWDDYGRLVAESQPVAPFGSGSERDEWQARNCSTCIHDRDQRTTPLPVGPGCPLLSIVLLEVRTPAQWIASGSDVHRCIEYRHEDDGPGPEPQPVPDPPGQLALGPREPLEGVRMLTPLHEAAVDPLPAVLAEHHVTDGTHTP